MSFTIPDAWVQAFDTNVRHLAQQEDARFKGCVIEQMVTGEAAYLEELAPTGAIKVVARHSDSPIMNSQHLRRRVAPYPYAWGDLIDRQDKLRLIIDPAAAYSRNAGYAMRRAYDDEVINAAFGTAFAGHAGATSLTWPNGNSESTPAQPGGTQVAVNDWTYGNGSGNVGLTVSKLISAQVALLQSEGDENEEIYIAIGGKQRGNLLATTEFTSAEYNETRQLLQKRIQGVQFMGMTFIHSERLAVNGSGQFRIPAWRKSGLGIGIAQDAQTRVAERPDKRFSWYVYADEDLGAARLEEPKVVEIVCV